MNNLRDLKYLFAYAIPASAILGLSMEGVWSWSTPVLAFVILPVLELLLPQSKENIPEPLESERSKQLFFDWLLYLNAPLLFGIVGGYLWVIAGQKLDFSETLGLTLSAGIVAGTCGINVAHEIGHRPGKAEQVLAQIMLLPTLYQHFFIEHNQGHHKNVATDQDPASARLGENVFEFWVRSVTGGWRHAWTLERQRLNKAGLPVYGHQNRMLRYAFLQAAWLGAIGALGGIQALIAALAVAIIGFLLLETVNYIEHYGLRRLLLPNGWPEPVSPKHSWNSDHELGRIMLYELTRHSDHHYKSTRKYQILRHLEESPQLPVGYPASIVIALVPPLWFRLMNKRVLQRR